MELNVGDYVRTKEFGINRVKWFDNGEPILENGFTALQSSGYKSNPKIIDLIEVGDYVNDYYVEDITNTGEELVLHIITGSNYFQSPFLYNEDIKSVLTHEQFEAMKYVVGDTNVKD